MNTGRIGIITSDLSLFSNGLVQNAYFIYKVLKNLGYKCDLLCWSPNYKKLDYEDIPVRTISDDEEKFRLSNYKLIITVAEGVTEHLYAQCKKHKVYVIGFICGNSLCMNLEKWVQEKPQSTAVGKERPVDELWLIGAFSFMKTYIELLRGAKARLVPHLWSPGLLENHIITKHNKTISDLMYNEAIHSGKKIDIIILEPNINFVKTALIPLMAAEKFHILHGGLLNEVFVFNFPMQSKDALHIVNSLTVKSKLRKFKSLHIAEILLHFNKKDTMPIFVSHQLYTHWNYLYYELMYYGYPLVHNSNLLKEYCYQYNEFDIDVCADQIHNAFLNHTTLRHSQQEMNYKFLKSIDPDGDESKTTWKGLVESVYKI